MRPHRLSQQRTATAQPWHLLVSVVLSHLAPLAWLLAGASLGRIAAGRRGGADGDELRRLRVALQ
jgi:hypothetical protein